MNALVCLSFCLFVPAADDQDNPEYKLWSKFKPGSSVTMKMVTEASGMKTEMVTTTVLKSLSDGELVLESKMTMSVAGQNIEQPAMERKVPAKMPKVEVPKVEEKDTPKPKTEEGTEDLEIAGKKVACKWSKVVLDHAGTKTETKSWTCDAVPGGVVRMETVMKGETPCTTSGIVTAYEAK